VAGVEQGKGNIGKLIKDEELYNRLNGIGSEMQQLLVDVRSGHGTISKLIYDDALYQELRSPIKRADAIWPICSRAGSAGKFLKDPCCSTRPSNRWPRSKSCWPASMRKGTWASS